MRISDWSSDVCSSDLVAHQSGEQGLAIRSLRQMAGKIERKAVEYRDTPEDRACIAREMMDMVLHISAKEAAVAASGSLEGARIVRQVGDRDVEKRRNAGRKEDHIGDDIGIGRVQPVVKQRFGFFMAEPQIFLPETAIGIGRALTGTRSRHNHDITILMVAYQPIRQRVGARPVRSEEPTSELQSLMRTSYAVFC